MPEKAAQKTPKNIEPKEEIKENSAFSFMAGMNIVSQQVKPEEKKELQATEVNNSIGYQGIDLNKEVRPDPKPQEPPAPSMGLSGLGLFAGMT